MIKEGFIICDNNSKKELLKKNNGIFLDYTFLSIKQLMDNLTFDVKKEGLFYLSKELNTNPEIVKSYFKYFKYQPLFFDEPKLNDINKLIKMLDSKGYLIRNKTFIDYLKSKNVTFYHPKQNQELNYIFKLLKDNMIKYDLVTDDNDKEYNHDIYEFDSIRDESIFVFNEIKKLLDKGIDLNKIKIANYHSDYDFTFKRLSSYYHIPLNYSSDKNILSLDISILFLELIKRNSSKEVIIKLKDKYPNSPYLKKIINIINAYHMNDSISEYEDIIKMELRNIPYEKDLYESSIDLVPFNNKFNDDEYVFLINLNQNFYPRIYQDIEYLTDDILSKMNLDTSILKNDYEKKEAKRNILNTKNLIITYKLKGPFNSYLPSNIINELGNPVKHIKNTFGVNKEEDFITLALSYDNYYKYNSTSDEMKYAYDINYMNYDNTFSGINNFKLDKVSLSYTSLSTYYKCPFSYYLKYILKVSPYEEELAALLGSYAHLLLEKSYDIKEDLFNDEYKLLITNNRPLTNKENFFFNLTQKIVKKLIDFNNFHEKKSELKNHLQEQEINISLIDDKLYFVGKVDKILYSSNDNEAFVAVIDYKTGSDSPSLKYIDDGYNLQLPIYLYLIKKSELFKNPEIIGFYLQKLEFNNDPKFKLKGFTKADISLIKKLDPNYSEGSYIDKLKMKENKDFYSKALILTKEEESILFDKVNELILKAYDNISNARFEISPRKLKNKDMSCTFCEFKDICYRKYEDYKSIIDNTISDKENDFETVDKVLVGFDEGGVDDDGMDR